MPTTYVLDDLASSFLPSYTPSLSLAFGTNLFAGLMPNSPDECVALFEYPGGPPDYVFGPDSLPAISSPRIQVLVRDTKYALGRPLIENVVRALETIVNQTVNGTYYERVERLQEPYLLHRDAARRVFFACNLHVMRTPS
jgi:hypothetical protein